VRLAAQDWRGRWIMSHLIHLQRASPCAAGTCLSGTPRRRFGDAPGRKTIGGGRTMRDQPNLLSELYGVWKSVCAWLTASAAPLYLQTSL